MINVAPIVKDQRVDHLLTLIDRINDTAQFKKRVEELEKLRNEVNTSIDNLTKAKNLDAALAKARLAENTANTTLDNARDQYSKVLEAAKAEAEQIISEARSIADRIAHENDEAAKRIAEQEKETTLTLQNLQADEKKTQNALKAAQKAKADAQALRSDYESKLHDLKERLKGL